MPFADYYLAGQRQIFDDGVVADRFRAAFGIFSVEFDALFVCKTLLGGRQSLGLFQESHVTMFLRHDTA